MTKNWNSEDVDPTGFFIFRGWWMCLPVCAGIIFSVIAFIGTSLGVSFPVLMMLLVGMAFLISIFVILFVNGRPKHYFRDLSFFWMFRIKCFLYMNGFMDEPPSLWVKKSTPAYPR